MSVSNKADFFLDFQQFGNLRLEARKQNGDAAQAVAQQFEGLFVQQMLSAMRAAAKVDDSQRSSYLDFYQDSYDKQLAQTIAVQDRLGIARMILQQIPETRETTIENTESIAPAVNSLSIAPAVNPPSAKVVASPVERVDPLTQAVSPVTAPVAITSRVSDNDFAEVEAIVAAGNRWQKAQQFVADVLPQAQSAAASLGVSAELLVAQAALETGWGKHAIKFDDGRNSFNLFGIKANAAWQGSVVQRESLEFKDGVMVNQVSKFRAYPSPGHSLADYVSLIQTSPRYAAALNSGDDLGYIREIQRAGYATDPDYADKIIRLLNGEQMQQALANINPEAINHA